MPQALSTSMPQPPSASMAQALNASVPQAGELLEQISTAATPAFASALDAEAGSAAASPRSSAAVATVADGTSGPQRQRSSSRQLWVWQPAATGGLQACRYGRGSGAAKVDTMALANSLGSDV